MVTILFFISLVSLPKFESCLENWQESNTRGTSVCENDREVCYENLSDPRGKVCYTKKVKRDPKVTINLSGYCEPGEARGATCTTDDGIQLCYYTGKGNARQLSCEITD